MTGGEIADRAVNATSGASSLRLKGHVPDDESTGTIQIDMALNKKGECAGTMSMDSEGKADVIKTGDTMYMKYDEAFLRAQGKGNSKADTNAVVAVIAGKWTKMKATGKDAKDIASFCDLDTVLANAEDLQNTDAARGRTTTVNGTPAIALHDKGSKDRTTVYVATEGKPYILKAVSTDPKDAGRVTFTDYEKPVPAEAPKGKVIDLDALGG